MIYVTYTAVDGYRAKRKFNTLKYARSFAHDRVGAHPDMGRAYAVSNDGIGKVEVTGCTLGDLFPVEGQPEARPNEKFIEFNDSGAGQWVPNDWARWDDNEMVWTIRHEKAVLICDSGHPDGGYFISREEADAEAKKAQDEARAFGCPWVPPLGENDEWPF